MRWFRELPIGRKLAIGFGLMVVLVVVVGVQGMAVARRISALMDDTYRTHSVPALQLKEANVQLVQISRAVRNALLDESAEAVAGRAATIVTYDSIFRAEFGAYQQSIAREEQRREAEAVLAAFTRLRPQQDAVVDLAREGRDEEGRARLTGLRAQADSIDAIMDRLARSKAELMTSSNADAGATASRSLLVLTVLVLVAVALATLVGFAIARPITRGLRGLTVVADAVALGDVEQRIDTDGKDEVAQLGDAMRRMVDAQRALATAAGSISRGDLTVNVQARSERDALGNAFVQLRRTVADLTAETAGLVASAREGDLQRRGALDRFEGSYRELVTGINSLLDAVVTPIDETADVLRRIADRDLAARMTGRYAGDFDRIKASINSASETLDAALGQVRVASEQVSSAGSQIASGSQGLAQGASSQAAALEEIASSLQEMSATSAQAAENAKQAREMAGEARARVSRGRESMSELSTAMEAIRQSSDQTARIVKTIDEIAFQTNLLALNAAVEAARAGDAGRGFAVVAEEVRALAIRSADAARTTATLIDGAVANAQQGASLNAQVVQRLDEIEKDVARVNGVVSEIAMVGEQQRAGVEQINEAVERLNAVTQQVAANAEESAAAAEELAGQSVMLQELVDTFRTSDASAARDARAQGDRYADRVHDRINDRDFDRGVDRTLSAPIRDTAAGRRGSSSRRLQSSGR